MQILWFAFWSSLHLDPCCILILAASWSSLHRDPHCILILVTSWSTLHIDPRCWDTSWEAWALQAQLPGPPHAWLPHAGDGDPSQEDNRGHKNDQNNDFISQGWEATDLLAIRNYSPENLVMRSCGFCFLIKAILWRNNSNCLMYVTIKLFLLLEGKSLGQVDPLTNIFDLWLWPKQFCFISI